MNRDANLDNNGGASADPVDGAASRFGIPRGIWSRQTILRRHSQTPLISNANGDNLFNAERLDPAGYQLCLGPEVYVSPLKAEKKTSVQTLDPGGTFFIPSGQFAFLLTEEVVTVPSDALAFITLRSTAVKFKGLVNVSGFHADPGYHGRLIFAVYNAGPADIHLRCGDPLFMIMFADLDHETDRPRERKDGFMNIPTRLITDIGGQFQSLAGLKENIDDVEEELEDRLNKMEREMAVLRWAVALFLGALIAVAARAYLGHGAG